jgi:hypothetical protein
VDHGRDVSGRNALIFPRTWYFGRAAPSLPETFGLWLGDERGNGRRGERPHELDETRVGDVLAWLDQAARDHGVVPEVVQLPDGFELRAPDDEFDAQMAVAREVMARRKRALRELAK